MVKRIEFYIGINQGWMDAFTIYWGKLPHGVFNTYDTEILLGKTQVPTLDKSL